MEEITMQLIQIWNKRWLQEQLHSHRSYEYDTKFVLNEKW